MIPAPLAEPDADLTLTGGFEIWRLDAAASQFLDLAVAGFAGNG